jgi:hypothetical protein
MNNPSAQRGCGRIGYAFCHKKRGMHSMPLKLDVQLLSSPYSGMVAMAPSCIPPNAR